MKTSIGLIDIFRSIGTPKMKAIKLADYWIGTIVATLLPGKKITAPPDSPKSLLVIRPGGIGDAIFLLPFLRKIKEHNPTVQIDLLCEKRNVQVFESQQNICDDIFCYNKFSEFKKLWNKTYDVVIDTEQWHYLSALVAYFIKSHHSIGFASRPLRAKLFNTPVGYTLDAYEVKNFRNLFLSLLPETTKIKTIANTFSVNPDILTWTAGQISGEYLTLFLGASIALRRLNLEQCHSIIQTAFNKGLSVVILGGSDVAEMGNIITARFPDQRLFNFAGKASLLQTAALIKESIIFVGPDSGIMHLACAVGTPVTAIFGPGNVTKWGPQGANDKIISLYVECSPCTRFGYTMPTCHGSYHCMRVLKIKFLENYARKIF